MKRLTACLRRPLERLRQEAREEREAAERSLHQTRAQGAQIHALAEAHRDLVRRNHFAESLDATFARKRTA